MKDLNVFRSVIDYLTERPFFGLVLEANILPFIHVFCFFVIIFPCPRLRPKFSVHVEIDNPFDATTGRVSVLCHFLLSCLDNTARVFLYNLKPDH